MATKSALGHAGRFREKAERLEGEALSVRADLAPRFVAALVLLLFATFLPPAQARQVGAGRGEQHPTPAASFRGRACRRGTPIPATSYDLGARFAGLRRRSRTVECNPGAPKGSVVASGPAGPVGFVSVIYGTCRSQGPFSDGCGPPLEIQTWPECARNLNSFRTRPGLRGPEEPSSPEPTAGFALKAAPWIPAESNEGGMTIEIYAGRVTIVIFSDQPGIGVPAAEAIASLVGRSVPRRMAARLRFAAEHGGDGGGCKRRLGKRQTSAAHPALTR